MSISKQSVVYLLLIILIFSVFVNTALYLGSNQLFAYRLALPFCVLLVLVLNLKVDNRFYRFLQVFSAYTLYTLGLTLVYPKYAEIGDILNFTLLFFYIVCLVLFLSGYMTEYKKVLARMSLLFIVLYLAFAFYEIFTGNHLPASALNEFDDIRSNAPSVVYTNPNDFCMALTLMLCYCFIYFKQRWVIALLVLLLLPSFFVFFVGGARLNILLMCFFLFVLAIQRIRGIGVLAIIVACLFFGITFLVNFGFDFDDFNFNDESSSIRATVYQYALSSAIHSKGLGFGVNTGQEYFRTINDSRLEGIIDPHSYAFEILINSGIFFFLLYILFSCWVTIHFVRRRAWIFASFYIVYFFVLFSSSSSIFQSVHYLFFCLILAEALTGQPSMSNNSIAINRRLCTS